MHGFPGLVAISWIGLAQSAVDARDEQIGQFVGFVVGVGLAFAIVRWLKRRWE